MLRLAGGIVAGLVTWAVVATVLNFGLRHGWPAYAAVEPTRGFTLAMLCARLVESAVATVAAGAVAARIGGRRAGIGTGVVLLLMFLPVHVGIWTSFPLWYHLVFFASLPLLAGVGGRMTARG